MDGVPEGTPARVDTPRDDDPVEQRIRELIAAAPPLSPEIRAALAELLS